MPDILLSGYLPNLATTWQAAFLYVGAILGIILMTYSILVEQEHRQDIIRLLGAGGLLVYAIYIRDLFFIIAMAAVAIMSLIEFIEIYLGLHKHSPEDLKKYKALWRTKKK